MTNLSDYDDTLYDVPRSASVQLLIEESGEPSVRLVPERPDLVHLVQMPLDGLSEAERCATFGGGDVRPTRLARPVPVEWLYWRVAGNRHRAERLQMPQPASWSTGTRRLAGWVVTPSPPRP